MSAPDLSFSAEEYRARLDGLRAAMQQAGLGALIVDEIEAMTYFSGYGVSDTLWRTLVVPRDQAPFLMVRSLDAAPARADLAGRGDLSRLGRSR